ncbi:MAG TPA: methyl-accepting chemotaxis protein [Candidatus Methanoperedenaceae archaeon]|nr:methyl-accepting chemotaxis protein [Candidatus Methanoperedenaceae archaeon]
MKTGIRVLDNINIKAKLLITITANVLVILAAAAYLSTNLIDEGIGGQIQTKMIGDLGAARMVYGNMEHKLMLSAYFIASNDELYRDMDSGNISTYIQSVKKQYPFISTVSQRGENLVSDAFVSRALRGTEAVASAIVPIEDLAPDKLDGQARLDIIPTDGAMPSDKKIETSGMMIKAANPIYVDGKIVGAVVVGHLINKDFSIVDETKNAVKVETSTIFMNDLRISTNVKKLDGNRAIGTRVSIPVYKAVLQEGKTYYGRAFVVNAWYVSAYEPIYDIDKKVIGILYVGTPEAPFVALREDAQQKMLVIGAGGLIFAILLGIFMSNKLTKPIYSLVDGAEEIAKRDLTKKIRIESTDEIGILASSFNKMTGNLKNVLGKVQKSAMKVSATAEELSSSSGELKASTDQISGIAQVISQGVNQQSGKMQEIAKALKEMTESVQQVAANAQNASAGANDASKTAQDIGKLSRDVSEKIVKIRTTVDDAATVIRELDVKSQKIGEIISVITSIADQTNLLALNAAIEAARAGEHGRGFAVVAEEVRKLAEESRDAANQITMLIKEIQQGTNNAVVSMEQGTNSVSEGVRTIDSTLAAINRVVDASGSVAGMAQEIAAAAEEQSASVEEVTAPAEEVSAISEESAASTEEASAAAQEQAALMDQLVRATHELFDLSTELQAEILKFNIGEELSSVEQVQPASPNVESGAPVKEKTGAVAYEGPELEHEIKYGSSYQGRNGH